MNGFKNVLSWLFNCNFSSHCCNIFNLVFHILSFLNNTTNEFFFKIAIFSFFHLPVMSVVVLNHVFTVRETSEIKVFLVIIERVQDWEVDHFITKFKRFGNVFNLNRYFGLFNLQDRLWSNIQNFFFLNFLRFGNEFMLLFNFLSFYWFPQSLDVVGIKRNQSKPSFNV